MQTITHTQKERGRSLIYEWLIDERDDGCKLLAVLSIDHHGKPDFYGQAGYCYTASLGHERQNTLEGGFTVRELTIDLGGGSSKRFPGEPCQRYSRKSRDAYGASVLAMVEKGLAEGDESITRFFEGQA